MKKIRIAQVGTAHDHAGVTYASLRRLTDDFDVVGIAEPIAEHTANLQKKFYLDTPTYTVDELLAMDDLDAVAIETDEEYATEYAQLFADRGVAVHLDKPGSHGLERFTHLVGTLRAKNLPLHMGYMYRYNPLVIRAFHEVAAGHLGEIIAVEAQMSVNHPDAKRAWLGKYPGGMMYFLGCHLVDLIYRLQGEPDEVLPMNTRTGRGGVTSEDYGFVAFKYPHGVSFAKAHSGEYNGFERRQLVIIGTKGTIELKPLEKKAEGGQITLGAYTHTGNEGNIWRDSAERWETAPYDRYDAMMREFAQLCRGEITMADRPWGYDYEIALFRLVMRACGAE